MLFYLPNWQLFLLGLTAAFSLATASHNRLKFIVQHTSTEIWSIKTHHICWDRFKLHHEAFCFKTYSLSRSVPCSRRVRSLPLLRAKGTGTAPFTPPRMAFPPSNTSCSTAMFPFLLQLHLHPAPDLTPQERGCGAALWRRGPSYTEGILLSA